MSNCSELTKEMKALDKLHMFKEIFSMIAVTCVAVWAIYSTWIKKEERIADLQVIELQQKTDLRSHLFSAMSTEQLYKDENGVVLAISVRLENAGNETVRATLDDRSVFISKVEFESNQTFYNEPIYIGSSRYKGLTKLVAPFVDIGSNEKYELSYVTKISSPGVYLIRFLSKMDSKSVKKNITENFGNNSIIHYSSGVDKIVYIQ